MLHHKAACYHVKHLLKSFELYTNPYKSVEIRCTALRALLQHGRQLTPMVEFPPWGWGLSPQGDKVYSAVAPGGGDSPPRGEKCIAIFGSPGERNLLKSLTKCTQGRPRHQRDYCHHRSAAAAAVRRQQWRRRRLEHCHHSFHFAQAGSSRKSVMGKSGVGF